MGKLRTTLFTAAMVTGLGLLASFGLNQGLNIGDKLPMGSVKMKDVSGKMISLEQVRKRNGLLVIFSCNTCPFVIATQDRYRGLAKITEANQIGMIAVNSNEAQRGDVDSFEEMVQFSAKQEYTFPYVMDEKSQLADAFGATKTPDIFLFDKDLRLVYKGAIDDSHRDASKVNERYLENAIRNMVAGQPAEPASTAAVGCTIKRVKP